MDDQDRDRRDLPEREPVADANADTGTRGASDVPPGPTGDPGAEPHGYVPAPERDLTAPAEIESWPSQDATTERPSADPWPTDAPAAGTGSEGTWPTAAPVRHEEPSIPGEVEASPASPAAGPTASDAAGPVTAAHAVPAAASATGESTQCPRCGTENRPGLAFCRNCGQRLVAAGVASTVERPGAPEGSMACPRCGTHNRAGVAFCQNCGANLRGTAPGYVPPAAATTDVDHAPAVERRGAVLGPVVLLIGLIGIVTAYLLPFAYGSGSLFERAFGSGGYGAAFWSGYPEVNAALADQAYFGLAAPSPLLVLLLLGLAIAGFARAVPGTLQRVGLGIALLWSLGLAALFVIVELAANWGGDIVALLRDVSPAGIIFFLASLIVIIGVLTRFGRS